MSSSGSIKFHKIKSLSKAKQRSPMLCKIYISETITKIMRHIRNSDDHSCREPNSHVQSMIRFVS